MRRLLAGLRVIDLGSRVSAPFCAAILGEQGAEIIKIEEPVRGDRLRDLGPYPHDDAGQRYSLYWSVEGRGRKSVTLAPAGAPRLGEHTDEVLSSVLGMSSADLAALRADNVI